MSKSWKRDNIFDIVNSQDALQIAFKSHPKTSMWHRSKSTEVQIPDFEKRESSLTNAVQGQLYTRIYILKHFVIICGHGHHCGRPVFPLTDGWRTQWSWSDLFNVTPTVANPVIHSWALVTWSFFFYLFYHIQKTCVMKLLIFFKIYSFPIS